LTTLSPKIAANGMAALRSGGFSQQILNSHFPPPLRKTAR